ncbi:hypothetical protein [Halomonas denitrificans]|nr:hypothetical protein [Halomonas denitrificans]
MSQKNNTSHARSGGNPIARLLESEPGRSTTMVAESGRWRLDASLTPIPVADWAAKPPVDETAAVRRLFSGEIVNASEQRAALHPWLRREGSGRPESIRADQRRLAETADALYAGRTPVRTLLNVAIGGSDLGPRLVFDALDRQESAVDVRWLSTLDDRALTRQLDDLDPSTTGLVVASKSFSTRETLLQAGAVRSWLGADWAQRTWAATARPERAAEWGVEDAHVLPFDASVGGRFSVWSSIGLAAAAAIGPARWAEFLDGAAIADHAVSSDPTGSLAGRLAQAIDGLIRDHGFGTLGVVAYEPAYRRLAGYLQQLIMESLGKRVDADGNDLAGPSSPLVFGGAGTDLQHSLFQTVHQGLQRHPMLLVGAADASHSAHGFGQEQLAHLLGQARALALGCHDDDAQRVLPGGNPVLTLLTRRPDARALGELLALWEHATYLLGVRWGINPFDQWGVEEGKRQAARFRAVIDGEQRADDAALNELLAWLSAPESNPPG